MTWSEKKIEDEHSKMIKTANSAYTSTATFREIKMVYNEVLHGKGFHILQWCVKLHVLSFAHVERNRMQGFFCDLDRFSMWDDTLEFFVVNPTLSDLAILYRLAL